jgi:hypothetical protein
MAVNSNITDLKFEMIPDSVTKIIHFTNSLDYLPLGKGDSVSDFLSVNGIYMDRQNLGEFTFSRNN